MNMKSKGAVIFCLLGMCFLVFAGCPTTKVVVNDKASIEVQERPGPDKKEQNEEVEITELEEKERNSMPKAAATTLTRENYQIYQYMPDTSRSLGTEVRLSDVSKEIAGKVYYELKEEGEKPFTAKVAVVAAVPLSDFKRETEFGRLIGEYLLTDLADRGLKVSELRLGKEICILPQTGEFIMSRNIGELANNHQELEYIVISTFSNTRKTLILQGRLVSLKDGQIKSSWRHSLPLNRDLLALCRSVEKPFSIAVKGF